MDIPDIIVEQVKARRKKKFVPADVLKGQFGDKIGPEQYRKAVDDHNRVAPLGRNKKQPLREKPAYQYTRSPAKDVEKLAQQMRELASDDIAWAQVAGEATRPRTVSKARHGIALRAALREPMLNANPRMVAEALKCTHLPQLISGGLYEQRVVKPKTTAAAKAGRNSSFWGERRWGIHRPKYGRGYFIRYDTGGDSRVYGSMGELDSAIKRSGFEIIRR